MPPSSIPIFPLPEVILFPGTFLPLHIFEPRYRLMIEYCSESENELAIAPISLITASESKAKNLNFESVFGWGKIVNKEYLPDGRSNIIVEGKGLVEFVNYHSKDPFIIGNVKEYKSLPITSLEQNYQELIANVLHLTKRILLSDGAPEELLIKINQLTNHPFPIDFISSILHFDFPQKQAILVEKDPYIKLEMLRTVLEKINLRE